MPRPAERVVDLRGSAVHAGIDVTASEPATTHAHVAAQLAGPAASEELNDTRHRVGAIQHTGRAAHDLDAIEVVRRERGQIVRAARRVDRDAVDENLCILTLPAANEERGRAPIRARLRE